MEEKKPVTDDKIGTVSLLTSAMLAAGLGVALVGARPRRCMGEMSSVRLQFQTTQQQIQAQISANQAAQSGEALEQTEPSNDGK